MQRVTPAAAGSAAAQKAVGRFVINLMSSTTPMALAQPNHPSLKQYAFFITRRRQDRSERFRLHMGYFDSQQQAEAMLVKVREIFPSAWAGIAPGNTEQKQAAERRSVTAASYELAHVPVAMPPAPKPAAAKAAVPESAAATSGATAAAAPIAAAASAKPAAQTASSPPPAAAEHHAAAQSLQSVRAAIDALDDGADHEASLEDTSATAQLKALTETAAVPALNDRQVLKVLEATVESPATAPAAAAATARAVAPAAATHTKPVAKGQDAAPAPAPAPAPAAAAPAAGSAAGGKDHTAAAPGGFAVQLQWSASPIDIAQLPYLAIFEAYTLYIAEGKREDRRWYGLRLGFFSDGASAKQVAQYLRSEFSSVVVVPISARERDRATRASKAVMPSATPGSAKAGGRNRVDDYQLLDVEVATGRVPKNVADQALKPELSKELQDLASNPVKTTAHKAPLTLEETLEILGANNLAVQDKNSEMLNNSAVRSLRRAADAHVPEKRSALGKLFERLGESLGR
jgi:hypothetical protein